MCITANDLLDRFSNEPQDKKKFTFKWESVLKRIFVVGRYTPGYKNVHFTVSVGKDSILSSARICSIDMCGTSYPVVNGIVKIPVNVFRGYLVPNVHCSGRINLVVRYTNSFGVKGETLCYFVKNDLHQSGDVSIIDGGVIHVE